MFFWIHKFRMIFSCGDGFFTCNHFERDGILRELGPTGDSPYLCFMNIYIYI